MVDRPEMFAPTRGFSGMADSVEPCKMLWYRPLLPCHGNDIWPRRGDLFAYRLVIILTAELRAAESSRLGCSSDAHDIDFSISWNHSCRGGPRHPSSCHVVLSQAVHCRQLPAVGGAACADKRHLDPCVGQLQAGGEPWRRLRPQRRLRWQSRYPRNTRHARVSYCGR